MVRELSVWMHGERVATLTERRSGLSLTYTGSAVESKAGRPLLSVSMPVQGHRTYRGAVPHAFFNGLLPEGEARRMIAHDFHVAEDDVLGLLGLLGRDCAGALVVIASDEVPPPAGEPEAMTEHEVAERLRHLRVSPLGVDDRVRVSLAGTQEKLLLAKAGGGWALPVGGAPSTHILKPAHPFLRDSIANEAFCMRVASHLDVPVAEVALATFEDRPVLVVERFDRATDGGEVTRLHQEDFCQALGLEPVRKYESGNGPALRQCAGVFEDWTQGEGDLFRLFDVMLLNVVLGNADAHAKNISLLHGADGRVSMAPAYDLMSTTYYPATDRVPGMLVNGKQHIEAVSAADVVAEGMSWGLSRRDVERRGDDLLDRLPWAVESAASDVGPPGDLVDHVASAITRLKLA